MSASHHVTQLLKSAASSPEMRTTATTGLHKALGKPHRQFLDKLDLRRHTDHPTVPVALPYTSTWVLAFGTPPGHRAPQPAVGHHRHPKPGQGGRHTGGHWGRRRPHIAMVLGYGFSVPAFQCLHKPFSCSSRALWHLSMANAGSSQGASIALAGLWNKRNIGLRNTSLFAAAEETKPSCAVTLL